ncbi:MAG TPA: biotin-dependent carboxyltransferase family protein [Thermoflexales bacterium]|nr:biotin-dependent carboxyltransferase family protein [Thermoflexales bacterium]
MSALRVLSPGGLALVQDLGRPGYEALGVPRAGAMDAFALQAANLLVGNPAGAAALELLGGGAEFMAEAITLFAVCGADLEARLNDERIDLWRATRARPGARLSFGGRAGGWGARAYLALAGGVDAPAVLGSRSAYLAGGFGRPLGMDDLIAVGRPQVDPDRIAGQGWPAAHRPEYARGGPLRLLPGPHARLLPGAFGWLLGARFTVSPTSNRQGLRLAGGGAFPHALSLPSLGVLPGAIQLPPDGQPILLGADAQTTGGYPLIGMLIQADAPRAGQLLAGDGVRFAEVAESEALAAWREMRRWIEAGPERDPWADTAGAG